MRMQEKLERKTEVTEGTLFGVTMGITFISVLLIGKSCVSDIQIFDRSVLRSINIVTVNNHELFMCVLGERLLILPVWFLLSTTHLAKLTGYLVVLWYGISVGITIGVVLLKYGIGAFLLLFGVSMPQYLFYVPVFILALKINQNKRMVNHKFYIQLVLLEILVVIGCWLESYINPGILMKFSGVL